MPSRRQVLAAGLGGLAIIVMPSLAVGASQRSSKSSSRLPDPAGWVQETPPQGEIRLRQAEGLIVLG
ncbi:hypothetical protein [Salinicola lusitanus]|uniref:hypothetical protein n=1 Tax=Salinicola lusitanus TaxID=1949085 RepID=UPI000DA117AF|nr:hypothetical protein [Salinicola lusitanus]